MGQTALRWDKVVLGLEVYSDRPGGIATVVFVCWLVPSLVCVCVPSLVRTWPPAAMEGGWRTGVLQVRRPNHYTSEPFH